MWTSWHYNGRITSQAHRVRSKAKPLAAETSTPFKEPLGKVLGPGRDEASGYEKSECPQ